MNFTALVNYAYVTKPNQTKLKTFFISFLKENRLLFQPLCLGSFAGTSKPSQLEIEPNGKIANAQ
jgi:hypothetical protein